MPQNDIFHPLKVRRECIFIKYKGHTAPKFLPVDSRVSILKARPFPLTRQCFATALPCDLSPRKWIPQSRWVNKCNKLYGTLRPGETFSRHCTAINMRRLLPTPYRDDGRHQTPCALQTRALADADPQAFLDRRTYNGRICTETLRTQTLCCWVIYRKCTGNSITCVAWPPLNICNFALVGLFKSYKHTYS